jgi:hypothetical protein
MLAGDIKFYLSEFHRILSPAGAVYLTAFIEPGVPDVEENPEHYLAPSSGALHRVRYEENYFLSLVKDANFQVSYYCHRHITRTQQSVMTLHKNNENSQ